MPREKGGRVMGNPWLSIWTSPRKTVGEIARKNPSYRFFFFCFIYGFVAILQSAQRAESGASTSAGIVLLTALILGIVIGYISLSISSLFLTWTGKWLGGKGTYLTVRTAVAWSNVPVVVDLILWLLMIAVFGSQLFTPAFGNAIFIQSAQGNLVLAPMGGLLIPLGLIRLALGIWSIVIFIGGLSAVQGFSIFKAILNALLSIIIVFILVWIAVMAVVLLLGATRT